MTQFSGESLGAIVLCGGRSSRMGRPKHELLLGSKTTLQRVVQAVGEVATSVVVVGASGTTLPPLPSRVRYIIDEHPFPGPLAALAQGLSALPEDVSAVFLLGCDMPLVSAAFLRHLQQQFVDGDDIVAVDDGAFPQPLAAIYRRSVINAATTLLAGGTRSLQALLKVCRTKLIPSEKFRQVDPELDSLRNMNSETEYRELLRRISPHS